jgi:TRAP-type uncharacterized transport system substrate-binding protein
MKNCHAIIISLFLFALTACDASHDELRLAVPASSADASIAADLASLFDDESAIGIRLTATPLAGSAALDALSDGSADIAIISNNLPFRDDVATIMPLYSTVLHIGYRIDRPAESPIELIRGATVYAGIEGSASRLTFERIVNRLGLTNDDYRYVAEGAEDPDVIIVFAPISPDQMQDYPEYRLFTLGAPADINTGTIIDAAVLLNPQFRHFVIPAGAYGSATPEAIVTIAVDKLIVARSDLKPAVVYELINEILRLRPALAARYPGLFPALQGDFDASRSAFKLHSGTQDYLQRSAPTIYERYSGVAEVVVTLLIGLISAGLAGIRLYQMRRKNRIDTFYSETIALRQSVTEQSSTEERHDAIRKVSELQTKAFELLVDEKLAADESFRIFITLSNDALRELKTGA